MYTSFFYNLKMHISSIKKNIITFFLITFIFYLIILSSANISSAISGIKLWGLSVFPSQFCFFVATELLSHTFIIETLNKTLSNIMKPLFNVPGESAFALIMGIISGYPTGAKIICDFRKNNLCTKAEAERLLSFTNNSGPLFIIGTVGTSMFQDTRTGFLLFFTHILACISVGLIFRFWKYNSKELISKKEKNYNIEYLNIKNLGEILGESILNSIKTLILIGGFIIFFSVIISIIKNSGILKIIYLLFNNSIINPSYIEGAFLGIIEITNGINAISLIPNSNISINIIICSFLLGTGGISVLLQVSSIISKSDISIKPYIIGKILHGILACIYTFIFINYISIFNLNI